MKGSPETRVQWFSDTPGLTYLTTVFTEVLSKSGNHQLHVTIQVYAN